LVEAIRRLPGDTNIRLRIYGSNSAEEPEYLEHLRTLAAGDRRIEFCPIFSQQELPQLHRELDLVVMPSTWHENATIVLLECLALGTPAVVADVQGMAPFIEDGVTGFHMPVADAAALSRILLWSANNPQTLAKMSAACKPVLTIEEQAQKMEVLYKEVLLDRGKPA
jgi:glycosyltransferase involved in cell wall biosynthesis